MLGLVNTQLPCHRLGFIFKHPFNSGVISLQIYFKSEKGKSNLRSVSVSWGHVHDVSFGNRSMSDLSASQPKR